MNGIKIKYYERINLERTDLATSSRGDNSEANTDNYLGAIALSFDPLIFSEIVKDYNVSEIEFGEYPQSKASEEISKKLESIHNTLTVSSPEKIEPTNDKYTPYTYDVKKTPVLTNMSYSHDFVRNSLKSCKVFLYNGEKYLRYKNKKDRIIEWFKVEPLKWKVDREKKELISAKSFANEILEDYWYDASRWDYGLMLIRDIRESEDKTNKFLNDVLLPEILQTVHIKKTVKYQSYEELKKIITYNKFFECFQDFGMIEFDGPSLDRMQMQIINSMLGGKIKRSFKEEKKDEEKFSKFKIIDAKEKAENNKEREKKYREVLNKINDLKNAIVALELERGNASRLLKGLLSSITVPEEVLIINVGDHREFNPEFIPLLKYIDLSLVDSKNLKLSNLNLSETNLCFDPQVIHNKDLSNSKLGNHNMIWAQLKGVILNGADIEEEEESYDLENAIVDDNTKLPKINGKAL